MVVEKYLNALLFYVDTLFSHDYISAEDAKKIKGCNNFKY